MKIKRAHLHQCSDLLDMVDMEEEFSNILGGMKAKLMETLTR
jgi:hypothetical protein